jgi:hypothetical protein
MGRGPGKKPRKWYCPGQALQAVRRRYGGLVAPAKLGLFECRENVACETVEDKGWAAMMVDRVVRGVRPIATLPVRRGRRHILQREPLERVLDALALGYCFARNPRGGYDMHVFQKGATLAQFYDAEHAVALYQGAGCQLTREALDQPLEFLAGRLYSEDFGDEVQHPLLGLCFGHPVHEAVASVSPRLLRRR